jgi:hypothetical protein
MTHRIIDMRMTDGSRHFGALPETYTTDPPQWYALRDHVALLPGARLSGFATDEIFEAWIDFELGEHRFAINNQSGEWWFFVDDPACPDALLGQVLVHFERLLAPEALAARRGGPIAPGTFRAVVNEADGRVTLHDFADLDAACRYADDAAWEVEDGPVYACVVDSSLLVVHTGNRRV